MVSILQDSALLSEAMIINLIHRKNNFNAAPLCVANACLLLGSFLALKELWTSRIVHLKKLGIKKNNSSQFITQPKPSLILFWLQINLLMFLLRWKIHFHFSIDMNITWNKWHGFFTYISSVLLSVPHFHCTIESLESLTLIKNRTRTVGRLTPEYNFASITLGSSPCSYSITWAAVWTVKLKLLKYHLVYCKSKAILLKELCHEI